MRGLIFGALLALGVAAACNAANANPPGTRLNADQIRQQLIGHTMYGTVRGLPYEQYISPDGTQKIKMSNFSDGGTYRITPDGLLCRTWRISAGGKEECVSVYKNGNTYYSVTPEGSVRATYTAKPGDPDHL